MFKINKKDTRTTSVDFVLVSLMLTLDTFNPTLINLKVRLFVALGKNISILFYCTEDNDANE